MHSAGTPRPAMAPVPSALVAAVAAAAVDARQARLQRGEGVGENQAQREARLVFGQARGVAERRGQPCEGRVGEHRHGCGQTIRQLKVRGEEGANHGFGARFRPATLLLVELRCCNDDCAQSFLI